MIELFDTQPDVNVHAAEYHRLLGYPRGRIVEGRALELCDWARNWYASNGRPWVYAREAQSLDITNGSILIDGVSFSSSRLQSALQQGDAHSVVLVAVSAGPEVEAEAHKLWLESKPDEYFFLEIFGSAVVEHLTTMVGARLCGWAERQQMAVLPHYSPGYPEWDIAQQPHLLNLIRNTRAHAFPQALEVLDSGMLRPKKSLLAVFGLTRSMDRVRRLPDISPCENCSFTPCQYRRAPYRRAPRTSETEIPVFQKESPLPAAVEPQAPAPLNLSATYSINSNALRRWAADRLTLRQLDSGGIDARFEYEGKTCSNMGRTLRFVYQVHLGPREDGYPIRAQQCTPAAGDEGHKAMCSYLKSPVIVQAISAETPLVGQPLDAVLTWLRPSAGASCYCEARDRTHKWGLVLETIHFALAQQRGEASTGPAQSKMPQLLTKDGTK